MILIKKTNEHISMIVTNCFQKLCTGHGAVLTQCEPVASRSTSFTSIYVDMGEACLPISCKHIRFVAGLDRGLKLGAGWLVDLFPGLGPIPGPPVSCSEVIRVASLDADLTT